MKAGKVICGECIIMMLGCIAFAIITSRDWNGEFRWEAPVIFGLMAAVYGAGAVMIILHELREGKARRQ